MEKEILKSLETKFDNLEKKIDGIDKKLDRVLDQTAELSIIQLVTSNNYKDIAKLKAVK